MMVDLKAFGIDWDMPDWLKLRRLRELSVDSTLPWYVRDHVDGMLESIGEARRDDAMGY